MAAVKFVKSFKDEPLTVKKNVKIKLNLKTLKDGY